MQRMKMGRWMSLSSTFSNGITSTSAISMSAILGKGAAERAERSGLSPQTLRNFSPPWKKRLAADPFIPRPKANLRQEEKRLWKQQHKRRELVPKERLWQAIKWECSSKELDELGFYDKYRYEKDHYYDFGLILEKIHAFMAGERSVRYFTSWLILLMRCLQEALTCPKSREKEIYDEIAEWFDGTAFMSSDISDEEKRTECLELIAILKDLDHRLKNIEAKKDDPFTKNGVITYVTFAACINGDREVALSKVCVVDEDRETVNYLFVPDIIYREEINYTFLTDAEFDRLTNRYCEYSYDGTMKENYAMTKANG